MFQNPRCLCCDMPIGVCRKIYVPFFPPGCIKHHGVYQTIKAKRQSYLYYSLDLIQSPLQGSIKRAASYVTCVKSEEHSNMWSVMSPKSSEAHEAMCFLFHNRCNNLYFILDKYPKMMPNIGWVPLHSACGL